ncbi:4Fe-4S binding protein [Fulvivirga lutimaris]|uniref:4Fe-4S binding protein n=1 Tax=Fulvivirga lutimaris TaxID=1819566 RepID=UPI0012BD3497|nr:4Fe-4S binding protein [Fulvivirga lutimaris]MTI40281.1 4Fe-4S binding protein [Fulvivirga lutimaris]
MKIIKSIGLLLFIAGFSIFISTFFSANYKLSEDVLSAQLGDAAKIESFKEHADFIGESITSNFAFVAKLDEVFRSVNQEKLSQFGISEPEIDKLVNSNQGKFDISTISLFGDDETGQYKQKTFKDYGGWLDGREFGSQEEIRSQISNVVENIKKYQIVNEKGFDKYKIKDLKYSITKASSMGKVSDSPGLFLLLTYVLCIVGALMYILPKIEDGPPGIKNNGIFHSAMKNVGWLGILTGSFLIVFYIVLYFYPEYMTNWIIMVDPVSQFLKGSDAGRFFLYGFIYTLCILVMGVRMIIKYRHSKYQIVRTFSVMFFQTAFAFLIPEILLRLNQPYFDFKNIWPLDYDFFFDNELNTLMANGSIGVFMLGWGIALIIIGVPVFVYFFGKRWYCSWVCGCGGLAETLGDPYRQLSDKSLKAWKVERWMIHAVLAFAIVMTGGVLYTYWTGSSELFGVSSYDVRSVYGAWIGAGFAGVVGTGFYPLMGNRVWCRYGCPLAAYLGIVQRFKSRFRITTNGGQCISCGNCSTYCEMGIDVRWYAQRGQNIVRSSCVGCGVCSSVCPRGVLNLENADSDSRFSEPLLIGNDGVKISS